MTRQVAWSSGGYNYGVAHHKGTVAVIQSKDGRELGRIVLPPDDARYLAQWIAQVSEEDGD